MANVTQGLFGLDQSQRNQQSELALQSASQQYAQQTPMQAAQGALFRAGNQLGGIGAGLLGIKDPELEAQSLMQETAKSLDLKDHNAVRTVAQKWLQSGNVALQNKAMQLNDLADRTEESNNQRIKEKAAIDLATRKAERQAKFSEEYGVASTTEERLAVTRKYAEMPELIKMDEAAIARKEKYAEAAANDARDAASRKELQAEKLAAAGALAREGIANRAATAREGRLAREAAKEQGENYKATLAQEKINNTNEKQDDLDAKASRSAQGSVSHASKMIEDIKDAAGLVKYGTTGRTGQLAAAVNPGGDAGTLRTRIATIKANIGFDRLQKMRDESPTGGALGQVAVQELDALQSSIANLSPLQSDAELSKSFDRIVKHYEGWQKTVQDDEVARVKRRSAPQSITLPTATQRDAKKASAPATGWGKAVEK